MNLILATDYLQGQRARRLVADDFAAALAQVDLLATPTIPIPAPRIGQTTVTLDGKEVSALDAIWRNAFPTNLTGSPTLSIPCGFSSGGLPLGLQLIGRNFDEMTVLRAGHAFQSVTDWHARRPPVTGAG